MSSDLIDDWQPDDEDRLKALPEIDQETVKRLAKTFEWDVQSTIVHLESLIAEAYGSHQTLTGYLEKNGGNLTKDLLNNQPKPVRPIDKILRERAMRFHYPFGTN